jgi:hypothetical protein
MIIPGWFNAVIAVEPSPSALSTQVYGQQRASRGSQMSFWPFSVRMTV